jgi:VWFA-related protein
MVQSWAEQTQFKATVTGVMVPVYVRNGGRTVPALVAGDFMLADSGVPQEVVAIDALSVPLDVSLIVENSEVAEYTRARYQQDIADIRALLRPDDRLRLVAAASDVIEVLPLTAAAQIRDVPTLPPATTQKALYDAIGAVLVRAHVPGRQQLVIVLTIARDTLSVTGAEVLAELARRSSAQVHTLITAPAGTGTRRVAKLQEAAPASMDWEPARRPGLHARSTMTERDRSEAEARDMRERLVRVASLTGGSEMRAGLFNGSFAVPVRRALEELRASYILYYTPKGVPDAGWHPIAVTMKDPAKRYDIRARPGFMR